VDGVKAQDEIVGTLWSSRGRPRTPSSRWWSSPADSTPSTARQCPGIIKAVTKEGGKDFDGRLKFADRRAAPGPNRVQLRVQPADVQHGRADPVWDRLRYFLATEYYKTDDDRKRAVQAARAARRVRPQKAS